MEEFKKKTKLTFSTKFFYGYGSSAFGIKNNGFSYFVLFVYSSVLGLPAWMGGLALNLVLIADAITDPLVGYFSDRFRSRWGRRHPFMYAAALPVTLTYFFLWSPPKDLTDWELFSYLLICATIIRVFITFYEIPSTSLGPELTDDYVERTELLSYRYLFGWVGGLTTYNLVWFWFAPRYETDQFLDGRYNPDAWSEYGLVASLLILVGILVTSIGTHKHIPNLIEPPERKKVKLRDVLRELKETLLKNRSYMFLFVSGLFAAMAGGIEAAMAIYFDSFFWELSLDDMLTRGLCIYLSPLLALYLAPRFSEYFGKKKTVMYVWLFQIFFASLPFVLRLLDIFPENNDPLLLPLLCCHVVINVASAIIVFVTLGSMIMDLVEEIQLDTGRREEGVLFSARSFADKAISGFGLTITGFILSAIQFPTQVNPGEVPEATLDLLALWYIPITVISFCFALLLVKGYGLSRTDHEKNIKNPDTKIWKGR